MNPNAATTATAKIRRFTGILLVVRLFARENMHRRCPQSKLENTGDVDRMTTRRPQLVCTALVLVIVISAALIELAMGRVPWCRCGYIKLWHGVV